MSIARQLARSWRAAPVLPEAVARVAKMHLLDSVGVGLAASRQPAGEAYRRFSIDLSHEGPSSVFGARTGAAADDAALINGGLIHSLEYDDTHTGSIAHGSSVMTACALAVAQSIGASGSDLLGAYVLGWETLIRIGRAAPGGFQASGFQVTSVGGALVSALIAAYLGRLDDDRMVAAQGIALSQASGVFEFLSNGSTVKSLHPGWAAHSGIMAANLAKAGLTGPETSFEGRFGLYRSFARDGDAAARFASDIGSLGQQWRIMEAAFKFHPCCHYIHPFIEAADRLRILGVTGEEVEALVLHVPEGASGIICEPWEDKLTAASGHAMRWSLPLVFASKMVHGEVTLDTFNRLPDSAVVDLARRISWQPMRNARFPKRFEAEVDCRQRSGAVQHVRIDDAYGNAGRPAAYEEVLKKFRTNASRTIAADQGDALAAEIMAIDKSNSLVPLGQLLRCR
jgi:2-methylcitrate dehydratase PrpD